MFVDERFTMEEFTETLYNRVKRKFKIVCNMKDINKQDMEDMQHDWWVNKLRQKNETYIEKQPSDYFRRSHYRQDFIVPEDTNFFDTLIEVDFSTELGTEIKGIFESISLNFGDTLAKLYYNYTLGYTPKELAAGYGKSERTIQRNVKEIREWVELNLR